MKIEKSHKNALPWLWVSGFIIVLDQFTKYFANQYLQLEQPLAIFPFFNLTLQYNFGAAFGFLGATNGWQVYLFAGISIIVIMIIFVWLIRLRRSDRLMAFSLSLILGGACGNLIDRVRFSYVIDFFDFHIDTWHFATFNVADSAITIGAALLIIKLLFFSQIKTLQD